MTGLFLIVAGIGFVGVALFTLGALAIQAIGADDALAHALNGRTDDVEECKAKWEEKDR